MVAKSREYHDVLDLLDAGQHLQAVGLLYDATRNKRTISNFEFRLLVNALVRRGVQVTTA